MTSYLWDSVLQLTKSAQDKNSEPLLWAIQLSSVLNSAGIVLPSGDLAHLLVSYICFDNNVPISWKFVDTALSLNVTPPLLFLSLLSTRVIPNRKMYPVAYRLYMELAKRHAFSFAPLIKGPDYAKTMVSVDDVLGLSNVFGLQLCEPGLLLVAYVFSFVWQLLDASLDDEGLLELTPEKKSTWLITPQDMDIDGRQNLGEKHHQEMLKVNNTMAIDLIGEFLKNKTTSRVLYLACQNMPLQWRAFLHRVRLLAENSSALRNSKHVNPDILLQLTTDTHLLLSRDCKRTSLKDFRTVMCSEFLISSTGQCHGASSSALWLPIDLFLEDAMDKSQVEAISAVRNLTGLVKALQAVNCSTWHDTFLGLWIAALRLVHREREPSEGPVPRIDTCLSMLLSITTQAVANIIEEEEGKLLDEAEHHCTNQVKERQGLGKCHKGLITALQLLGDYDSLLIPPQAARSAANQAAAKAMLVISGFSSGNGYHETISTNDMAINCSGNMRHLIVEACIARKLIDTSAYFWPGYVSVLSSQLCCGVVGQLPGSGWSLLMQGSPLTPSLINTLVATPASSLLELEKVYEIAISGSTDEKISAATILCGASLVRGWNVQEHTMLFVINLLSPPIPADYSGSESHLISYAPLLNVLLVGISSVDCVQILSLLGLVPLLAGALMPICEVFGSCVPNISWALPSGEEISCHTVFSNAFTLLVRLWRFHHPPLENVMRDKKPVVTQLGPDYLLLLRNSQLASFGTSPGDRIKRRRFSKILEISFDPILMDSFSRLKLWYRHHLECIASTFSGLHGTPVHQFVDALLNMMFRRINRSAQSLSSATSGSGTSSSTGADDAYVRLQVPAWDILEATPFAVDAALTACAHGKLSPRELATGLKDLADFLPASLATIVSYLSAEVTRGIWKPAFMNGTDWPSPAANLSSFEQQIKKILSATGVNVPSLPVGGNSPATLPLPLAALVSLTITYRLDKASERFLVLVSPALKDLASSCPWPCMPIVSALWAQKVKRWSDFLVFSASGTVFHHNGDALVQLLKSCFTSTLGLYSPHSACNGGVGSLLGHGFGSHFSGGISPVAPGILYLRVHQLVGDVIFLTENILAILMQSVKEIADNGLAGHAVETLKKTKNGMRYGQFSLTTAMMRVKLAASLGASLVWISGGLSLVQSLMKETLPSWFISAHGSEQGGRESGYLVALLGGYALAYFAVLSGAFAWGVDSTSPASKRRAKVLGSHLEFLASALDGKISLGCDWNTALAYISAFLSLMVACAPKWIVEVNVDLLKRLSKGLRQWNEEELALALLRHGGVSTMGTAAEFIIETGIK